MTRITKKIKSAKKAKKAKKTEAQLKEEQRIEMVRCLGIGAECDRMVAEQKAWIAQEEVREAQALLDHLYSMASLDYPEAGTMKAAIDHVNRLSVPSAPGWDEANLAFVRAFNGLVSVLSEADSAQFSGTIEAFQSYFEDNNLR